MAKAVVAQAFGGPEVLAVVERELPAPGPGEVVVEFKAIGVNPIDYKLYSGAFGDDPSTLSQPVGSEGAGVVTAVGPDAVGPRGPISVGDEVVEHVERQRVELVRAGQAHVPDPVLNGRRDVPGHASTLGGARTTEGPRPRTRPFRWVVGWLTRP